MKGLLAIVLVLVALVAVAPSAEACGPQGLCASSCSANLYGNSFSAFNSHSSAAALFAFQRAQQRQFQRELAIAAQKAFLAQQLRRQFARQRAPLPVRILRALRR
jgi:hypothetical protein